MKRFKRVAIIVLAALVVLAVVGRIFLGSIVKNSVEKIAPTIVGAPVKLNMATFALLTGKARLRGFTLGNPEGFHTEKAMSVREILVDVDTMSLLSDKIIVQRIYIGAPDITYEIGLGKSNFGKIMDNVSGGESEPKEKQETPEEKPAKEGGKKVQINDFLIEDGIVRVSATVAGGLAAPVPLPTIHLKDIGKDSDGASVAQVVKEVFGAITAGITQAAAGSVKLVGEGVKETGKLAGEGAEAVGEGASKVFGGVKSLFGGGKKEGE